MKKKLKLIVSDFHLGKGQRLPDGSFNYLEDFRYDDQFVEFLRHYRTGEFEDAEVELICNGDFFNHLQVDINDKTPDIIDKKAAVTRTAQILHGHPDLFRAMREFAAAPGHTIMFLLGNHDAGLLFPAVQEQLRGALGSHIRILLNPYVFDGVHIEHGNQYFADNAYNRNIYFLTKNLPEPVVNLPWGSYFVIHLINKVKKHRPYFDKIYPFKYYLRWAFIHEPFFALRCLTKIMFYFIWLRFRKDPHRRSSFRTTLKILKELAMSPKLERPAKKILAEKGIRIVVFGHLHHAMMRTYAPGKVYMNTGLWNEQISLEISNPGRIVRLTYGMLEYDEQGGVHPFLKEWKGTYRVIEDV